MDKFKQDINLLEKPLWFVGSENDKIKKVWTDVDGYEYRAGYKLPDSVDIVFLMYFLLKVQEASYREKIILTRYEVIKACGFNLNDSYYARLEESLKRWTNVTIEFKGTFYDGKKYISMLFHIIDNAKIREEDNNIEIDFNSNFLLKIKESTFFKYIHFSYFKTLKRPVSRRLFEILCKSFKGREIWDIDLVKLGTKLTLSKRKIFPLRGKPKEVMYHSDVLTVLRPAINEINKLAQDKKLFVSMDIPYTEAFFIDYELKSNNKIIRFIKRVPDWVKQEQKAGNLVKIEQQEIIKEDATLTKLYELMKSPTKGLREEIGKYYREKGFEYVTWNIEYANKTATKNYTTYLKKCLKENWGGEFREVETTKVESEKVHQEVKNKNLKESQSKDKEILALNKRFKELAEEEQLKLRESAKAFYLKQGINEKFMNKEMIMAKVREIIRGGSSGF